MPNAIASLAAALVFAAGALPAAGQTLYKWIDDNGKTQYSDKPPKAFKGEVTRIEPDYEKSTLPPAPGPALVPPAPLVPAAEAGKADRAKGAGPVDIGARRRATRLRLEADLARARDKVEVARKALEQAETPEADERQTVQQRVENGGLARMAPRATCRVEVIEGKKVVICPMSVPTSDYYDRRARLEEALAKAEEELAAAEQAWRRGVD